MQHNKIALHRFIGDVWRTTKEHAKAETLPATEQNFIRPNKKYVFFSYQKIGRIVVDGFLVSPIEESQIRRAEL